MRSKLFIPGDREDLADRVMACHADAASIDFEDTVAPSAKETARQHTRRVLDSPPTYSTQIVIRVNALSTPLFEDDIAVAVHPAVGWINVPKVEDARECREACERIERLITDRGLRRSIGVIASLESPEAIDRAHEIASAHPLLVGLQISYADLFEPLGIDRRNEHALGATRFVVKMAAARHGLFVVDGVMPDVTDPDYFRADAEAAAAMGIEGKSCFDDQQVAIANEVFQPSAQSVEQAQRVLDEAAREAESGTGLFELDGRMVDEAYVRGARRVLQQARWADRSADGPSPGHTMY